MAKKRAIDAAREYKKQFIEELRALSQAEPLAGLRARRCERYIYLQFKDGESPKQQWKAACNHWKELYKNTVKLRPGSGIKAGCLACLAVMYFVISASYTALPG